MKKFRSVLGLFLVMALLIGSLTVYADDNADTGSGDTSNALDGKGFYRGSEYLYKVSVYVGLSDTADKNSDLGTEWRMVGANPIFVKPSNFTMPSGVFLGSGSKVDYQNGDSLASNKSPIILTDTPPPIPITHGGNINDIKSYFGDTKTLIGIIDVFADQKGTSREGLVY